MVGRLKVRRILALPLSHNHSAGFKNGEYYAVDNGGTANTAVSSGVAVNSAANAFNIVDGATTANGADPATVTATVLVTGLSTDEDDLVSLTAGSSKSFRIVVTGISTGGSADVLDILRTVPASSELYITVTGTDGSTSTISDPRSTRVTQR